MNYSSDKVVWLTLIYLITILRVSAHDNCCKNYKRVDSLDQFDFSSQFNNSPEGERFLERFLKKDVLVPQSFDWRIEDPTRLSMRIMDQFANNSWAYAATGLLEGIQCHLGLMPTMGQPEKLSEQFLTECSGFTANYCRGKTVAMAIDSLKNVGFQKEADYPTDGTCHGACRRRTYRSYMTVRGTVSKPVTADGEFTESDLQKLLVAYGPIAVSTLIHSGHDSQFPLFKSKRDLQRYHPISNDSHSRGFYAYSTLLVGYGVDSSGYNYWVVKNSMGNHWSSDGYAYLHRERYDYPRYRPFHSMTIAYWSPLK